MRINKSNPGEQRRYGGPADLFVDVLFGVEFVEQALKRFFLCAIGGNGNACLYFFGGSGVVAGMGFDSRLCHVAKEVIGAFLRNVFENLHRFGLALLRLETAGIGVKLGGPTP